jgi:hypothetical protein
VPTPDKVKSGQVGYDIGVSAWQDPAYRKAVGLPPGKPFSHPPGSLSYSQVQQLWTDWENRMGYYRAGGPPPGNLVMADQPAYSGALAIAPQDSVTYTTRARHAQLARGLGPDEYYAPRRMNVGNVRALRRSMRRVQGFAKLAKKVITFTHHVKMKKRRRK